MFTGLNLVLVNKKDIKLQVKQSKYLKQTYNHIFIVFEMQLFFFLSEIKISLINLLKAKNETIGLKKNDNQNQQVMRR
jgi:hypothetical protein